MDTRKVLEMGGGTVIISLPKDWARKNGIVRGSTVAVEEISARRLLVRPIEGGETAKEAEEVVIEYPRENLSYVTNDVTGAYLMGSNAIRIEGKQFITREDRSGLKSAITKLVGLEIVAEDAKGMTMQFLLDPAALGPEKIVRRMASLIGGMLRDSGEGLRHDRNLLALVGERDDEVDRLYFLLVRTIRTATIDPEVAERYRLAPIECLDYRVLASYLEGLGDSITEFSKRAGEETLGKEVTMELVQFLESLEKMGDVATSSFLTRRLVQGRRTYIEVEGMRDRVGELSKRMVKMKGISTGAMLDLLSLLERIASTFVDISDLALPTYQFKPD
ncbi:MAG: phosphate uptake regulator PhoU [Thaumarchaeota archaeon]|nr:phosphate uptake regulator PhoU [Nitrososphaerota archaeon]